MTEIRTNKFISVSSISACDGHNRADIIFILLPLGATEEVHRMPEPEHFSHDSTLGLLYYTLGGQLKQFRKETVYR